MAARRNRGVAIIGMAGRFPGASSIVELERRLIAGEDLITRFPADELGTKLAYVGARGVLDDIEMFDHAWFGVSPAEAALIDPQQRVFLQCAAHALEDAGYDPWRYDGAIGVYAGVSTNSYVLSNVWPSFPAATTGEQFQIMVANDKDYLATRASYRLNLKGPSYSIQTACSTSLVAVHQACQGLLTGECDIALAGGATVKTPQTLGYNYEDGLVFSRSGRVRAFDDHADGTVMSDGVGVVVLKLLEDALADGDTVIAVIRGSATNNDGAFKASYAAPSRQGQARVIREALAAAGVDARTISYVEAHGTGTRLGDPVEVSALTEAFRSHTQDCGYCDLGSIKPNIGHMDSAAGVGGLIKLALMLRSKTLFPTIHYERPNTEIDFARSPFRVCESLRPWTPESFPRRAGVSSFGIGGTNAHVIVEEPPPQRQTHEGTSEEVLVLSALTADGVRARARDLAAWFADHPDATLADVAFTLGLGRRELPVRAAVVCRSVAEAIGALSAPQDLMISDLGPDGESATVVVDIPDGAADLLRWAAGRTQDPWLGKALAGCLAHLPGETIQTLLARRQDDRLARFAILYGLAEALRSGGVSPRGIVGEGLGALVAATLAEPERLALVLTTLRDGLDEGDEEIAARLGGDWRGGMLWRETLRRQTPTDRGDADQDRPIRLSLSIGGLAPEAGDPRLVAILEQGPLSETIADIWRRGGEIDWTVRFAGQERRRIALPHYPFAKIRHWLEPEPSAAPIARALEPSPTPAPGERRGVLLARVFKAAPLEPAAHPKAVAPTIRHTAATLHLAETLLARLGAGTLVAAGDRQALAHIACADTWIDLAGCDPQATLESEEQTFWRDFARAAADGSTKLRRVFVVNQHRNLDDEAPPPAAAARAGLCQALCEETPGLTFRRCDLSPDQPDVLVARIIDEVTTETDGTWARHQGGRRSAPTLEQIASFDLDADGEGSGAGALTGPVLITGGGGGLGVLLAQHLVRAHGVRDLVLGLRSALPPREAWSEIMAPRLRRITNTLLTLEDLGARVLTLSSGLTDPLAFKSALLAAEMVIGPIRTVVHAAGAADLTNRHLRDKNMDDIAAVLAPKAVGMTTLAGYFTDRPVERLILFSSVAGLAPSLSAGQADYACANAYLDAAASAPLPFSKHTVSLVWPSWKESGMGEATSVAYRRTGLLALSDREGLVLFDKVVASGITGPIVPAVVECTDPRPLELLGHPTAPPMRVDGPQDRPATEELLPIPDLQTQVQGEVARILRIPAADLDPAAPLHRYGADSILLAQIARRLGTVFDVEVDVATLLEHITLEAIGAWLRPRARGASPPVVPVAAPPDAGSERRGGEGPQQGVATRGAIAVIGMSCRFPGAPDLDAYHNLLEAGRRAIGPVPPERWRRRATSFAGLIEEIDRFDAAYFRLTPQDAAAMDPQALLLLEESLRAISHAGYAAGELEGRSIGVYVGARSPRNATERPLADLPNPILAVSPNYLAANISTFFDLQGPSLVVDTACSSSLVALDLAVMGLRSGVIEAALVAGVNLLASPEAHDLFAQRGLLAAGAEFHVADQRCGGVVLGEGAGVVVLKPLSSALADGDTIYAVIEGLAVNNDGRTAGPTVPSFAMQKAVMQRALTQSGRAPGEIQHIELNGSGSEVTDILELKALEAVYRPNGGPPCLLGSLKPNIGHTLCAHGMAGFIKTVLMLHRGSVSPFLSGQEPLRHYPIEGAPFGFCRSPQPWTGGAAAISAFADGGTNAHVILSCPP